MARVGEVLNVLREFLVNIFQAGKFKPNQQKVFNMPRARSTIYCSNQAKRALILILLFKTIKPFVEAGQQGLCVSVWKL